MLFRLDSRVVGKSSSDFILFTSDRIEGMIERAKSNFSRRRRQQFRKGKGKVCTKSYLHSKIVEIVETTIVISKHVVELTHMLLPRDQNSNQKEP